MVYTTKERNNAILLVAAGKADLSNALIERLEEFQWVIISRLNGLIHKVKLSKSGEDLSRRLLKQQVKEN